MPSPNHEDVYSLMGFTLSYIQSVERNMKFVTTYVLQDGDSLTLEKLESINKKERKKALGYFIGKIRDRASLFPNFEELLSEFLNKRNDFVHNQDKIPGWDLSTPEGVVVARTFVISLLHQAHIINEIFAALLCKWQEQTGIYPPQSGESNEYINSIEERYGVYVDILFTEKET